MDNAAVLSDNTIMEYNKKGLLIEQQITPIQLQPNSVDLTLGNSAAKIYPNASLRKGLKIFSRRKYIDTRKEIKYIPFEFKHKVMLAPGEFVLMASREILNIPNGILCFVQGRSSIARLGIQTEQAGLIDAGFRGTITFEVFNEGIYPIALYSGMRIAQVYFFRAEKAKQLYGKEHGSKYTGQIKATGSKIHLDQALSCDNNGY